MRNAFLIASALVMASPAFALAHQNMAGMTMKEMTSQGASAPVRHSDQTVKGHGLSAVFLFDAPKLVRYNCPMHPYEVSKHPGKDDDGMTMHEQNLTIGLLLKDAHGKALKAAHVHLTIKDPTGLTQNMNLANTNGLYQSSFWVPKGHYQLIADIKPDGKGKPVIVSTPYQMN